ncbi:regulatory protein RecX [Paenibacillus ginsengarvi]|uniref:Regulatory protein RecX n=1 Tax=Paenibacillus ginsengarvi TaxID=400777 RepID=A0A3B0CNE0_9BACL|nr:RecX family transcriptional regulator [Paenibacillus ginsengarvi]RKN86450.1 RecX family transcriptional regulator [Paenibacillus ginsengarvi]
MTSIEGIITTIERHSRNAGRYLIFVDGQYAFTVFEDVLIRHRLFKGETIDPGKMQLVLEDEERQKAWSDALKQVGRRPRSEKELRQYLKRRGYLPPLIDTIIGKLKEQNYIDDASFAAQWTEQRIYSQKKGRQLIKQELKMKGVAPATIQTTLDQVPPEEEERLAYELGHKKWKATSGTTMDKKRKTAAFLMRRGYSSRITGNVIRRLADTYRDEADDSDAEDMFDWPET